MGRIVVVENVSLDGVMQGPGHPDEDTRGRFDLGGWASTLLAADPEAMGASMQGREATRAMLFGRRTYEHVVGHWLATTDDNPFTDILRDTPKYVVSHTLTDPLPHPNSTLLSGDLESDVAALKESVDGDIVVLGSGELVRALAAADLVDRYTLTTLPVVLGRGARLFGGAQADLESVSGMVFASGIVVATYDVRR